MLKKYKFHVTGTHCASCKILIEDILNEQDFVKNPELIIDRTFKNQNLIKQAGINFKQMNHAATKIQALGRGCIVRQNKIRTTSRIAI